MEILSSRMSRVAISPTLAISAKIKDLQSKGHAVIDLGVGEPDFPTPEDVKNAAIDAIGKNKTKYTHVNGTAQLRDAISELISKQTNVSYSANNVIVSTGAKQVIFNALMSTINHGDEVIIISPCWVSYIDIVSLFGGNPVIIETKIENGFLFSKDELRSRITSKTKWIMLNSPSNPSGVVYSDQMLKDISDVLVENENIMVMTDDIYEHIVYDGLSVNNIVKICPELKDRTLIVNGLSKAFCMTGWRIGYGVGNQKIINAMSVLQSQSTSNTSSISQEAALCAIQRLNASNISDIIRMRDKFEQRRNLALEEIEKIPGLIPYKPQGAFYLFINISSLIGKKTKNGTVIKSDFDFVNYLLEHKMVGVVHGSAFACKDHFRMSFSTSDENIKSGLNLIREAVLELV